jgi:hypothetical protein
MGIMADHKLILIAEWDHHRDCCSYAVRWCERCGAVVVDAESDGRLSPGRLMKMRRPEATKNKGPCDTALQPGQGE